MKRDSKGNKYDGWVFVARRDNYPLVFTARETRKKALSVFNHIIGEHGRPNYELKKFRIDLLED